MAKQRPVHGFRRQGNKLVPDSAYDLGALDGIADGELVRVEIKQWRNGGRHRAYWAMLKECVDATGCALNVTVLHEAVKLSTGCVDLVRLKSGMTVAVPGSISFDTMTEPEFVSFFQAAQEVLAREYGFVAEERNAA